MRTKKHLILIAALCGLLMISCKEADETMYEVTQFTYNDADRVNIIVSIGEKNGVKYLLSCSFLYKDMDEENTQIQHLQQSNEFVETFSNGKVVIDLKDRKLDVTKDPYLEFVLNEDGTLSAHYMLNILKDRTHVNGNCVMTEM